MIKVKKNFLDKKDCLNLQHIIMHSSNMPFYFQDTVAYKAEESNKNNFYLTHNAYYNQKPNSDFFYLFKPLLTKLDVKSLIRLKVNLYPRTDKIYHHPPHIDYKFKHKGCIYSLNSCDGGTKIGNKVYESVENQALLFDPSISHNSTTCTNTHARFNININYF